ncbi:hypothetical protein Efla_001101 [Eimeria flavescens]
MSSESKGNKQVAYGRQTGKPEVEREGEPWAQRGEPLRYAKPKPYELLKRTERRPSTKRKKVDTARYYLHSGDAEQEATVLAVDGDTLKNWESLDGEGTHDSEQQQPDNGEALAATNNNANRGLATPNYNSGAEELRVSRKLQELGDSSCSRSAEADSAGEGRLPDFATPGEGNLPMRGTSVAPGGLDCQERTHVVRIRNSEAPHKGLRKSTGALHQQGPHAPSPLRMRATSPSRALGGVWIRGRSTVRSSGLSSANDSRGRSRSRTARLDGESPRIQHVLLWVLDEDQTRLLIQWIGRERWAADLPTIRISRDQRLEEDESLHEVGSDPQEALKVPSSRGASRIK